MTMWSWGSLLVGILCLVSGGISQSVLVSRCERLPQDNYCSDILLEKYYYAEDALPLDTDDLNRLIFQTLVDNNTCTLFIKTLFCFYTYLPCDVTSSKLLPLCDTRCSELDGMFKECNEVFNSQLQFSNFGSFTSGYNCSNPDTYFTNIPYMVSNTSCSNVTKISFAVLINTTGVQIDSESGSHSRSESSRLSGSTIAVIAAIGGIVILTVLGICAFLIIRGKRRSRNVPTLRMSGGLNGLSLLEEMNGSQSSTIKRMLSQLLLTIKEKFSEVLIPANHIKKQDLLGKGAFGIVHKGELIEADGSVIPIAMKTMSTVNVNSIRDLVAESTVMFRLNHPNVLPLLGVCVDPDDDNLLKIILPFMANGDLKSFLKQSREDPTSADEYKDNINESMLLKMCLEIAKGMEYLAMKRLVHRDLAARNCMVDENYGIKVADFGLTRDIYTSEYYRADKHTTLPVKWMALESILDNYFDEKTDVWSYGVTCWEVFSLGRVPYAGVDNQNVISILNEGKRLDKPRLCPVRLFTLMESTWLGIPTDRPSFADIVEDLQQNVIR